MSEHNDPTDQVLDMEFKRPPSYVISLRLNAEESRALTNEARAAGEKLSTFIKTAALESVARRRAERVSRAVQIGGGDQVSMHVMIGFSAPKDSDLASSGPRAEMHLTTQLYESVA